VQRRHGPQLASEKLKGRGSVIHFKPDWPSAEISKTGLPETGWRVGQSSMKPYLMKYPCPHCKMGLQSEHTESRKTLSCPRCQKTFVTPAALPRPFGGWLIAFGVLLTLGYSCAVIVCAFSIFLIPLILPMSWMLYGFFMQRKWFVKMTIISNAVGIVVGVVFYLPQAILSLILLLYFMRSRRVKETFTT
jgi:hypothetical protein